MSAAALAFVLAAIAAVFFVGVDLQIAGEVLPTVRGFGEWLELVAGVGFFGLVELLIVGGLIWLGRL